MVEFNQCPVCGERCSTLYRADGGWGVVVGCNHCYTPPKTVCPVCGDICHTVYRQGRHSEIVGCDKCVYAVNAALDAEEQPGDYGLPDPEDEEE